jgi:glycosyltransferase involved in cell wall biosynthesis
VDVLESQACGTPVICTDAGAMSEFVAQDETGFVVASNSGEAIAEALKKVTGPLRDRPRKLREFRKWVEPLSWANVVNAHLRAYARSD